MGLASKAWIEIDNILLRDVTLSTVSVLLIDVGVGGEIDEWQFRYRRIC